MHLAIGDIATARDFYVDRLGFEVTVEMASSALFVSAGKYHHHIGMNVWNSRGAGRRARTLGLGAVDIVLPSRDDLGAVAERMRHSGVEVRDDGEVATLDDPWGNLVRLRSSAQGSST